MVAAATARHDSIGLSLEPIFGAVITIELIDSTAICWTNCWSRRQICGR